MRHRTNLDDESITKSRLKSEERKETDVSLSVAAVQEVLSGSASLSPPNPTHTSCQTPPLTFGARTIARLENCSSFILFRYKLLLKTQEAGSRLGRTWCRVHQSHLHRRSVLARTGYFCSFE